MSHLIKVPLVIAAAAAAGAGIWLLTDSTTASYVVAVVAAIAAIVGPMRNDSSTPRGGSSPETAEPSVHANRGSVAAGRDVIVREGGIYIGGDHRDDL